MKELTVRGWFQLPTLSLLKLLPALLLGPR